MYKDNRETVFQFLSAILVAGGVFLKSDIIIVGSIIPILLSIWFWYKDNIGLPIKKLQEEIKNLRKDLNIRKEIENIKMELVELRMSLKKNKKGALDPLTFIIIIVIIVLIILYLQGKGII